jgi:flavin reductase (DIM6/NTAB) family NADH-FMN oxidoreductase RutF
MSLSSAKTIEAAVAVASQIDATDSSLASLEPSVAIDPRQLRQVLGQFATGITVIATRSGNGDLVGLTANSFGALSLDPPLITWALRLNSSNLPVFQAAERFVVNVLAEAQVDVSRRFASSAANKFEGIPFALGQSGLPLIHGAAAWFECRTVSEQIVGDHCLFIAAVETFARSDSPPLIFHGGGYFTLGSKF